MIWMVMRPTKPGEMLANSAADFRYPREKRKKLAVLWPDNCRACTENWPPCEDIDVIFDTHKDLFRMQVEILLKNPVSRFKFLMPLLNHFGNTLPNTEFGLYYNDLIACLNLVKVPALFEPVVSTVEF